MVLVKPALGLNWALNDNESGYGPGMTNGPVMGPQLVNLWAWHDHWTEQAQSFKSPLRLIAPPGPG